MPSVLLAVEEIPEQVNYYLIPTVTAEEVAMLKRAHRKYINTEISERDIQAVCAIMAACAEPNQKQNWEDAATGTWLKKEWHKHKLDMTRPPSIKRDLRFVVTGMLC